jgi:D-amino-acid dehydrogenase
VTHVIVIGCGLAGITTAYYLREQGADVTVLERAEAPARETSFANGSLLAPSSADPWNAPGVLFDLIKALGREDAAMMVRAGVLPSMLGWGLRFLRNSTRRNFQASYLDNVVLSQYSQAVMQRLLQAHPLEFEYAPDGTLSVFRTDAAFAGGRQTASWLKQVQVVHEELDRDGLLALEPALAPTIENFVGAIRYPQDEVGNARLFCLALKNVAEKAGVVFRFSEQVLGAERERGAIRRVITPREKLDADSFVLAAGSYSWPVGNRLKIDVPVRPAKGYSLTVPIRNIQPAPRYAVIDEALHAAVVPLGKGKLRVAGTAEFTGFDTSLPVERLSNLKRLLAEVYPQIPVNESTMQPWCGLRPMTPDGRPLIGGTRVPNLFLNTGHGPLGWTMACGSGKAVADVVLGNDPEIDITPFAVGRF